MIQGFAPASFACPPLLSCVEISVLAPHSVSPDLDTLVALFYDAPEQLAIFRPTKGPQMPPEYRTLLDHQHHMTVTVERYHGSLVDVRVLDKQLTPTHY